MQSVLSPNSTKKGKWIFALLLLCLISACDQEDVDAFEDALAGDPAVLSARAEARDELLKGLTDDVSLNTINLQSYANQCADVIGAPMPAFNCSDGDLIEIRVDKKPQPHSRMSPDKCDNPSILKGNCITGSRIGRIQTNNTNVEISFICRRYYDATPEGEYEDIAVIHHNRESGATCWYQSDFTRDPHVGKNVSSPLDGGGIWYNNAVGPINCSNCHETDPFIHTPYLKGNTMNITTDDPVPHNPHGRYYNLALGRDWNDMEQVTLSDMWNANGSFNRTKAKGTCVECHRFGGGNNFSSFAEQSFGNQTTGGLSATSPHKVWMGGTRYQALKTCAANPGGSNCDVRTVPGAPLLEISEVLINGRAAQPSNGRYNFSAGDSVTLNLLTAKTHVSQSVTFTKVVRGEAELIKVASRSLTYKPDCENQSVYARQSFREALEHTAIDVIELTCS